MALAQQPSAPPAAGPLGTARVIFVREVTADDTRTMSLPPGHHHILVMAFRVPIKPVEPPTRTGVTVRGIAADASFRLIKSIQGGTVPYSVLLPGRGDVAAEAVPKLTVGIKSILVQDFVTLYGSNNDESMSSSSSGAAGKSVRVGDMNLFFDDPVTDVVDLAREAVILVLRPPAQPTAAPPALVPPLSTLPPAREHTLPAPAQVPLPRPSAHPATTTTAAGVAVAAAAAAAAVVTTPAPAADSKALQAGPVHDRNTSIIPATSPVASAAATNGVSDMEKATRGANRREGPGNTTPRLKPQDDSDQVVPPPPPPPPPPAGTATTTATTITSAKKSFCDDDSHGDSDDDDSDGDSFSPTASAPPPRLAAAVARGQRPHYHQSTRTRDSISVDNNCNSSSNNKQQQQQHANAIAANIHSSLLQRKQSAAEELRTRLDTPQPAPRKKKDDDNNDEQQDAKKNAKMAEEEEKEHAPLGMEPAISLRGGKRPRVSGGGGCAATDIKKEEVEEETLSTRAGPAKREVKGSTTTKAAPAATRVAAASPKRSRVEAATTTATNPAKKQLHENKKPVAKGGTTNTKTDNNNNRKKNSKTGTKEDADDDHEDDEDEDEDCQDLGSMTTPERLQFYKKTGRQNWGPDAHRYYPANYVSNPDAELRRIRKEKREKALAAAAAAKASDASLCVDLDHADSSSASATAVSASSAGTKTAVGTAASKANNKTPPSTTPTATKNHADCDTKDLEAMTSPERAAYYKATGRENWGPQAHLHFPANYSSNINRDLMLLRKQKAAEKKAAKAAALAAAAASAATSPQRVIVVPDAADALPFSQPVVDENEFTKASASTTTTSRSPRPPSTQPSAAPHHNHAQARPHFFQDISQDDDDDDDNHCDDNKNKNKKTFPSPPLAAAVSPTTISTTTAAKLTRMVATTGGTTGHQVIGLSQSKEKRVATATTPSDHATKLFVDRDDEDEDRFFLSSLDGAVRTNRQLFETVTPTNKIRDAPHTHPTHLTADKQNNSSVDHATNDSSGGNGGGDEDGSDDNPLEDDSESPADRHYRLLNVARPLGWGPEAHKGLDPATYSQDPRKAVIPEHLIGLPIRTRRQAKEAEEQRKITHGR